MNADLKSLEIEQRLVERTCACGYYIHMVYEFIEHRGLMSGLYYQCPACSSGGYIPDAKEVAKRVRERWRRG
jgi:hypothetical protein